MEKIPFPQASRHPLGPRYNDYELPEGNEFWRARSQIVTMWRKMTIALDVAASNSVQQISGDFIYCDMSSTGVLATLEFNNQMADEAGGFQVGPGWFHRGPFTLAKMSWAAQPGKVVKLLYATGLEAYPGTAGFTINGTTLTAEQGTQYGASFASNTNLGVAANEVIVAPASNTNGIMLLRASYWSANGTGTAFCVLLAKSSAPASIIDGDVLLGFDNAYLDGVARNGMGKLERVVRVPAGRGLYWRNGSANAETAALRSAQYTLL